jgi:hypothetical protein
LDDAGRVEGYEKNFVSYNKIMAPSIFISVSGCPNLLTLGSYYWQLVLACFGWETGSEKKPSRRILSAVILDPILA